MEAPGEHPLHARFADPGDYFAGENDTRQQVFAGQVLPLTYAQCRWDRYVPRMCSALRSEVVELKGMAEGRLRECGIPSFLES